MPDTTEMIPETFTIRRCLSFLVKYDIPVIVTSGFTNNSP